MKIPRPGNKLRWDTDDGCTFRFRDLQGHTLIYVREGERYVDWRWVEVENRPIQLKLLVDRVALSKLRVKVEPTILATEVALIPLDRDGTLPLENVAIESWLDIFVPLRKNEASVTGHSRRSV